MKVGGLYARFSQSFSRSLLRPSASDRSQRATLVPGIGAGPEITASVRKVFEVAKAPIEFDQIDDFDFSNEGHRTALRKNHFILAGNTASQTSPSGEQPGLNRYLGLFGRILHAFSLTPINAKHLGVDIVVVRENLEGAFSGIEHEITPGVFAAVKVVTRQRALEIAELAFAQAALVGRKCVTAVHKANIMKVADGLYLEAVREVAQRYPFLTYKEVIVDNCLMQMAQRPQQFDVMLTLNLYGAIVGAVAAGLVGGAGVAPAMSVGPEHMLFDGGCRSIGRSVAGRNCANPTALILAGADMLRVMRFGLVAERVEKAVREVYTQGKHLTPDVGGKATTSEFTSAVCELLNDKS